MIDKTESEFNDIREKDLHYSGFTLKAVEKHGRHQGWALPGGGFIEARNTNKARLLVKRLGSLMPGERTIANMVRDLEKRIKSL